VNFIEFASKMSSEQKSTAEILSTAVVLLVELDFASLVQGRISVTGKNIPGVFSSSAFKRETTHKHVRQYLPVT